MGIGIVIIGSELLSGKRRDGHMAHTIEVLGAHGLELAWCRILGDDPARIVLELRATLAGDDIVFSFGGIGATPDDHTRRCAAEAAGVDSLWVFDHVAIPPDEAEGSGGLYLDPLATLAYIAGCTQRIGLGTGVLVLPYRPALITAKWLATIQQLSGDRLLIGAAPGWMKVW